VVEPGGSVALAALLAGHLDLAGHSAVIVLSGGNVDMSVLQSVIH
jgi:threonine dehydratase